jgi:hypothetical protein
MPSPEPEPPATSYLPALTLVLLLLLLVAGWLLFPRVQAYMSEQDCIASGRTNCVAPPAEPRP